MMNYCVASDTRSSPLSLHIHGAFDLLPLSVFHPDPSCVLILGFISSYIYTFLVF